MYLKNVSIVVCKHLPNFIWITELNVYQRFGLSKVELLLRTCSIISEQKDRVISGFGN